MLFGVRVTQYPCRVETVVWELLLTELFARSHGVMNRSFGGTTLDAWFNNVFPRKITMLTTLLYCNNPCGAEWCLKQSCPDPKHVDLEVCSTYIRPIISILRENNKNMVTILIAPPPLEERTRNQQLARLHGSEAISAIIVQKPKLLPTANGQ